MEDRLSVIRNKIKEAQSSGESAENLIREAIEEFNDPIEKSELWCSLAHEYRERGKFSDAEKAYLNAIELDYDEDFSTRASLALLYLWEFNNPSCAFDIYKQAIAVLQKRATNGQPTGFLRLYALDLMRFAGESGHYDVRDWAANLLLSFKPHRGSREMRLSWERLTAAGVEKLDTELRDRLWKLAEAEKAPSLSKK